MLLKKLTLNNYSVFCGTQSIRLEPSGSSDTANIVLIGGKNGSGKTSILEALRIAFYGSSILNGKGAKDHYDSLLESRFNKQAVDNGDRSMWIEVEVAVTVDNILSDISIRRLWNLQDTGRIMESLIIAKDGSTLNVLESQQAEEFVRELIPQGISEFFLLDAEKIDKLALDETPPPLFTAALRSLLDIDIIERLSIDLDRITRDTRLETKEQAAGELSASEDKLERMAAELKDLERNELENEARIKELVEEEQRCEIDLLNRGVLLAHDRQRLESERKDAMARSDLYQKDFDHLLGELVPFLFAGPVLDQFESQLLSEQKHQQQIFARELVGQFSADLMARMKRSRRYGPTVKQEILKTIAKEMEELLGKKYCAQGLKENFIHGFGDRNTEEILGQLKEIRELGAKKIIDLVGNYETTEATILKIEHELARIPAEVDADDVVKALKRVRESIQESNKAMGGLKEKIQQKKREQLLAQREVNKAHVFMEHRNKAKKRVERIEGLQLVLKAFSKEVTKARIQEICDHTQNMHSQLARKKGEIARIAIDPNTLELHLFDRNGVLLSKERLSAGEKQIYAMSLLYGLAQASGKRLPVVVDTPLARFDEDHKEAMVMRYFPATGQQIILLTTDVEMDSAHFQMVEQYVSHTILLDYRDDIRSTVIKEGFFKGRVEECRVG